MGGFSVQEPFSRSSSFGMIDLKLDLSFSRRFSCNGLVAECCFKLRFEVDRIVAECCCFASAVTLLLVTDSKIGKEPHY